MMGNIFEAVMWVFMFIVFVLMYEMIKMSCLEILELPDDE